MGTSAEEGTSELNLSRLRAQLLSGPRGTKVEDVVERILAVQAQDLRGARLAVRARSVGLCAADVDRALTSDRSVVRTWLNRGTLHLVAAADYWWLQALTTPPLATVNARRLGQEGVSPPAAERGVEEVERALAEAGPLTRGQLRERLAAAGVPVAGQALVHILMLSALRGLTVRGPMVGTEQAFVRVPDWLGRPARLPDRDEALGLLCRRYLLGHSPATERDLATWSGLPLRDVRAGMQVARDDIEPLGDGQVRHVQAPVADVLPPPRLLGAFDPLLHGWVSREPVLAGNVGLVVDHGIFRPFALVHGRGAATWTIRSGRVLLDPFAEISATDALALARDAEDVLRFLGRSGGTAATAPAAAEPRQRSYWPRTTTA